MTGTYVYLLVGVALWLIGLQGFFLVRHVLRRIVAINLMGSGVFLILVALATRSDARDPVLHALVVTGLVVAVSATAMRVNMSARIAMTNLTI